LLDKINAARPFIIELIEFNSNNEALKELIERFGINNIKEKIKAIKTGVYSRPCSQFRKCI